MLKRAELENNLSSFLFLAFWFLGLSYQLPMDLLLGVWFFSEVLTGETFTLFLVKLCLSIKKKRHARKGWDYKWASSASSTLTKLYTFGKTLSNWEMSNVYRRRVQTKAWFVFTQVVLINDLCRSPPGE